MDGAYSTLVVLSYTMYRLFDFKHKYHFVLILKTTQYKKKILSDPNWKFSLRFKKYSFVVRMSWLPPNDFRYNPSRKRIYIETNITNNICNFSLQMPP